MSRSVRSTPTSGSGSARCRARPARPAGAPAGPGPGRRARPQGPPFLTSVSPDGRHFLDQDGRPILVKGDSPWALMTRLSPEQARLWFADRRRHGFNAAIVSLIGATENGAPSADGATFDGLLPFTDGDILRWQEPYWRRATSFLRLAADHGITVMLYPIDGWTVGHSFVPASIGQCHTYDAMLRGIRDTGDRRPFSMQLGAKRLSTRAVAQVARLRALFSAMPWWRLVPDTANRLVTAGRGTEPTADGPMDVLENDYVTAARTPDGRLAVPMAATFTTPGRNGGGDEDWLLVLSS